MDKFRIIGYGGIDFMPILLTSLELPVEKVEVVGKGERLAVNLMLYPDQTKQCRREQRNDICESGFKTNEPWKISNHEIAPFPSGNWIAFKESMVPSWLLHGFTQLISNLCLEQVNYFLLSDGRIKLSLVLGKYTQIDGPIEFVAKKIIPVLTRHVPLP